MDVAYICFMSHKERERGKTARTNSNGGRRRQGPETRRHLLYRLKANKAADLKEQKRLNMRAKRELMKRQATQSDKEVDAAPLPADTILDEPFRLPKRGVAPWTTLLAMSDLLLDVCRSRGLYQRLDESIGKLHEPSIREVKQLVRELKRKNV